MKTLNGVLFAVMFMCSLFADIAKAEMPPLPTAEETVTIEQGALVVKVTTETERYALPPVNVPAEDLPKVLAIVRQGEGVYEVEQPAAILLRWGIPMMQETQIVKDASELKQGRWSPPKRVVMGEPAKSALWALTVLLGIVAVGLPLVVISAYNGIRQSRKSRKTTKCGRFHPS